MAAAKKTITKTDIIALSLKDAVATRAILDEHIVELQQEEKADLLAQVQSLIEKSGFDTSILTPLVPQQEADATAKSGKKYTCKMKYEIDGTQWSGRGRQPVIVREYIENGGSLEDLLIDKD